MNYIRLRYSLSLINSTLNYLTLTPSIPVAPSPSSSFQNLSPGSCLSFIPGPTHLHLLKSYLLIHHRQGPMSQDLKSGPLNQLHCGCSPGVCHQPVLWMASKWPFCCEDLTIKLWFQLASISPMGLCSTQSDLHHNTYRFLSLPPFSTFISYSLGLVVCILPQFSCHWPDFPWLKLSPSVLS